VADFLSLLFNVPCHWTAIMFVKLRPEPSEPVAIPPPRNVKTLVCNNHRECASYNPAAAVPQARRMQLPAILQQRLFCQQCQHAYCKNCIQGHDAAACAVKALQPGRFSLEQLQGMVCAVDRR
jgi:hypothetical protein